MNRIIMIFIFVVMVHGVIKKVDMFHLFIEGSKEVFVIIKPVFVTLIAYMLFVELFNASGAVDVLSSLFSPLLFKMNIPIDIFVISLLRPISASASLSFLYSIYELFGVDHNISLLATMIQSGSDTTFYVIALYFSSLSITDSRYASLLGLFLDALAVILAFIFYTNFIV